MEDSLSKQHDPGDMVPLVTRIREGRRIIVDFTGSYCAPCKQLQPILAQLEEEYGGHIEVLRVDIEEHPELAQRYGVRAVPTLIAFQSGEVRGQQVGFSHVRRVREMFQELMI